MKNYLFYGPPGCGKSTVAKKIARYFNIRYISIGEVVRNEIKKDTKLGKKLKEYLDNVVEYPVGLISKVALSEIGDNTSDGYILDGYPKYAREAKDF